MADQIATPAERIQAFADAVHEELVIPTHRYLRGLRRGLLVGVLLGLLLAPRPGRESRERISALWRSLRRRGGSRPAVPSGLA